MASKLATRAVIADENGDKMLAAELYKEAVRVINEILPSLYLSSDATPLRRKAYEYSCRVTEIEEENNSEVNNGAFLSHGLPAGLVQEK